MTEPDVLNLLLDQTWQVAVIALCVWGVTRTFAEKQPRMAHLLWAIVLLKVLTPPIWSSPFGVFSWLPHGYADVVPSATGPDPSKHSPALIQHNTQLISSGPALAGAHKQSQSLQLSGSDRRAWPSSSPITRQALSWRWWLLAVWIGGAVFTLLLASVRQLLFARWVANYDKHPSAAKENVDQLELRMGAALRSVALKLRFRRKVTIRIVEAPIGPAVFGLLRPTIVLPATVVRNHAATELEPLIAHELIHVRRGDLWWAAVQALAASVFWFHPLVWLASRMLTRESERSCDEETIASLGCSAATYARCLLDVLERKNQLHVAPALPGVRPVDITRSRLERIMRLGQGSRETKSEWVWVVFIVCAIILLPGRGLLLAQDKPQAEPSEPVNVPAPGPAPPASGPLADQWQMARIDVSDLLNQLREQGQTREQAEQTLLSLIPQRSLEEVNEERARYGVSMSSSLVPLRIVGSQLHIFETSGQLADVKAVIRRLREYGFRTVDLSVLYVSLPKGQIEQLGFDWVQASPLADDQLIYERPSNEKIQPTQPPSTAPEVRRLKVPGTAAPTFFALLERDETAKLMARLQSDTRMNQLHAPRISMFNGLEATISDATQRPFVTGTTPAVGSGESLPTSQAHIEVAEVGTHLMVRPVFDEEGAIELSVRLRESFIRDVQTFTLNVKSSGTIQSGTTVQVPDVVSKVMSLRTKCKPEQTLVLTSGVPLDSRGDIVKLALITPTQSGKGFSSQRTEGTASVSTTSRNGAQAPVKHGDYQRIPIISKLMDQGDDSLSEPPSDNEILAALEQSRRSGNGASKSEPARENIRIVKQRIARYADPQRVVPLIGLSQLHHAHYKCTVHFTERSTGTKDKESAEVVYVDHNAFRLIRETE